MISILIRREEDREDRVGDWSQAVTAKTHRDLPEVGISKLGLSLEPSEGAWPADPLIFHFGPLEQCDSTLLLFKVTPFVVFV